MKVVIATVAYGGWYRKGLERQIREFERVSPGFELQGWLNVLPPDTPQAVKDGYDYTGYAAKPFAMKYAMDCGADVALLIDASVYPIRHIQPLIDFIWDHGYYLAPAGFSVGEWTSDEMLRYAHMDRDAALKIPTWRVASLDCGSQGAQIKKQRCPGGANRHLRPASAHRTLTRWPRIRGITIATWGLSRMIRAAPVTGMISPHCRSLPTD